MKRERESHSEATTHGSGPKPRKGGFHPDGNWNPDGTWDTPLGHFVRKLVMGRRFHWTGYPPYKASPADLARMIDESPFAEAFGDLEQWRRLESRCDWPEAHATRSSAQSVIVAGWGSLPGEWERAENELGTTGRWMPNEKALAAWREEVSVHQELTVGEF